MASAAPGPMILDVVPRRVMFALELVDPVTGRLVSDGMRVTAAGLGAPRVTASGRFTWRDVDPPAARRIAVSVDAASGMFQPEAFAVDAPAHTPDLPWDRLVERRTLRATGLYAPPAGLLAVAGMLIADAVSRKPVAGVSVQAALHADPGMFGTAYRPVTDARGGFVAAAPDLGSQTLRIPPGPAPEGGLVGWLAFTAQAVTRYSPLLSGLRRGRLLRADAPFVWTDLLPNPPPPP